jgi:hypothetical protein
MTLGTPDHEKKFRNWKFYGFLKFFENFNCFGKKCRRENFKVPFNSSRRTLQLCNLHHSRRSKIKVTYFDFEFFKTLKMIVENKNLVF